MPDPGEIQSGRIDRHQCNIFIVMKSSFPSLSRALISFDESIHSEVIFSLCCIEFLFTTSLKPQRTDSIIALEMLDHSASGIYIIPPYVRNCWKRVANVDKNFLIIVEEEPI